MNGVLASLTPSGFFFLNDVPLMPGANSLVLTVTSQDGITSNTTLNVYRSGASPLTVSMTPVEGLPGMEVTFKAENPGGLPVSTVEFDVNGDGIPDYVAPSLSAANVIFTFQTPGLNQVNVTFKAGDGSVLGVVAKRLFVWNARDMYALIKGVYGDFVARLQADNRNLALNLIVPSGQPSYSQIFSQLGSNLPIFATQLGTFDSVSASMYEAEAAVIRNLPDGAQAFLIYLIRGGDGIWRIESM